MNQPCLDFWEGLEVESIAEVKDIAESLSKWSPFIGNLETFY